MTTELLHRSMDATVTDVDTAGRRVTVQLCRWLEPREVRDPGGIVYREAYAADSIELAPDVAVYTDHHGTLIGRVDPESYDPTGDGPTVDLILSRSSAGADTLADVESGVIRAVSMEVEPDTATERDGVVYRTRSVLHGVAFAFRPAHDAPVLATRSAPDPHTETPGGTMSDTATATAPPITAEVVEPSAVTIETLNRSLDELRDDLTRTMIAERPDTVDRAALEFRSVGEYAEAVWSDPANPILRRALADQITSNNPGVVPPGWLQTVQGIVDRGAPAITAFGRSSLPAEGMDVNWPYFDGDLTTLVGEQMTQKTAITSIQVDLEKGSAPIHTWAGGSDIAYQLIRRSGPSYMAAYLRIMAAAYTATTDAAMADTVETAATTGTALWDPLSGDLAGLATALFSASVAVQAATGMPAQFALAASDVFTAAGALGVQNVLSPSSDPGTASAASLGVSVGGLPIIHDPYLTAGSLIVSNTEAATFHSEGPYTATAEDIEKLGQNVAVWGMGAPAVVNAAGIVTIPAA